MRRVCWRCQRWESDYLRMEEHHIFQGIGRRKISDRYGLVVTLCQDCHKLIHRDADEMQKLHEYGQEKAMSENGWSTDDFISVFGKNYL